MVDGPPPPIDEMPAAGGMAGNGAAGNGVPGSGAPESGVPGSGTPAGGKPKGAGKGFLASGRNRVIAIVAAVVVLFGILAIVAAVVLTVFVGGQAKPPADPSQQAGLGDGAVATGTVPSPAATEPAEQVSLEIPLSFEVFTDNKDPFKPQDVPEDSDAGDGDGTGTGAGSETGGETTGTATADTTDTIKPGKDVLYLHAIEAGTAVVYWDNERYEVEEGDQVDDSPWRVVSIGTSSATFLYGDDRITLRVGEQLGK